MLLSSLFLTLILGRKNSISKELFSFAGKIEQRRERKKERKRKKEREKRMNKRKTERKRQRQREKPNEGRK